MAISRRLSFNHCIIALVEAATKGIDFSRRAAKIRAAEQCKSLKYPRENTPHIGGFVRLRNVLPSSGELWYTVKDMNSSAKHRILYVSSSHSPWYAKGTGAAEHFKKAPYSIDAIGYNLEKRGWAVAWLGWRDTANPWRLAKEIDAFKPDIVYTYGGVVSLNPFFCRRFLCRHKAFKVVHGWDDEYGVMARQLLRQPFGFLAGIFFDWMEKRIVKNSDRVVTLSRYHQAKARKWGVECEYIPNGADPVAPPAAPSALKLEGRFKIVYCGCKDRWKRFEPLAEAMRHVPRDVKLYTTGHDEEYLKPYASDNCVFLGYLPREDQYAVMAQADAFAVTADQDCNAKLQEYLRWGKPILGYDGRMNLFFENGRNALLAKDYAPAIMRLASDPQLCATLARNAANDISVYSWAEIAETFERYFDSLWEGAQ